LLFVIVTVALEFLVPHEAEKLVEQRSACQLKLRNGSVLHSL